MKVTKESDGIGLEAWKRYVTTWKRRTFALSISLFANIFLVVPFLQGHSLHGYFAYGRWLIYSACTLLTATVGSAALTYNFNRHVAELKQNSAEELPPK